MVADQDDGADWYGTALPCAYSSTLPWRYCISAKIKEDGIVAADQAGIA